MAMGSRGTAGGDERDVFSRRARRLMRWRPGEMRRIKRRYTKRWRKIARIVVNRDANSIISE